MAHFYFAGRFLKIHINRKKSRLKCPIKLIFGYVAYFRGIYDLAKKKKRENDLYFS